jgi:hypothetical protein
LVTGALIALTLIRPAPAPSAEAAPVEIALDEAA